MLITTKNKAQTMRQENDKPYRGEMQGGAGLGEVCAVSACADQDIVASKWIALEGTARLAAQHKERLRERFPVRMIDEAVAFEKYLSVIPEAATATKSGVCGIRSLSQSGIFTGLWEMAQEAGVGLEVDLRKIPVRQETIEICEFFGENPYELASGGCLLMTAGSGTILVAALMREGIPAAVIGRTTQGKQRVVYNQGRKRFLDKPRY